MIRRASALLAVTALLALQTACLEDFEQLITTVTYDPFQHVFRVERRLVDIDAAFFQCDDLDSCADAISRTAALQPADTVSASLADRLVARLLDTGAEDLAIRLERRGPHLDARVTYTAAVGSKAAADTLVHAEWGGKRGKERYYLVLEAQDSLTPPDVPHELRKQSSAGAGWREFWVLPPKITEVTTRMAVDPDRRALFATIPGLDGRLDALGVLGASELPAVADVGSEDEAPEQPAVAEVDETPDPEIVEPPASEEPEPPQTEVAPAPAPARPPAPAQPRERAEEAPKVTLPDAHPPKVERGEAAGPPSGAPAAPPPPTAKVVRSWPDPDPASPARTWVHDPRISGALPAAVVEASVAPLIKRVEVCYQRRQAAVSELAGYAFLNARVRGDGWLVGTSVYGDIGDVGLIRCLEEAIGPWTFPPWGEAAAVSEVDVPLTFRVEVEPPGKRKKRGR